MSRRVSLPGADELFRTTGGTALQSSSPGDRRRGANGEARVPAPAGESDAGAEGPGPAHTPATGRATEEEHSSAADPDASDPAGPARSRTADAEQQAALGKPRRPAAEQPGGGPAVPQQQSGPAPAAQQQRRGKGGRGANRRPSGRERHDEKITVYVSAEELMDLEHARLVLRGEHGLAVDRGRIVREAVAVVLADLESRGDASILVRRLRGR
ncbi:hypothetical protein [Streptomyces sp. 8L]|uniref:hypothetical protein n=1 Tax=unclassified Streptomyces TaxID=2593676 RepID=UPI001CD374CD|nr:hypothetical protein [Streptomyces sp. 8L]MCA1222502.1 hypothetical protein [Streptomyces sp. 8L]